MYTIKRIERALYRLIFDVTAQFNRAEQTFLQPLERYQSGEGIAILCSGNICRSPYAAQKLKALLQSNNLGHIRVASFGTETISGKPADPSAARMALTRGVSLDTHKTVIAERLTLAPFGLLLAMEPVHRRWAQRAGLADRTIYLGALIGEPIIVDPYEKPDEVFEECFDQIDKALAVLVERIRR